MLQFQGKLSKIVSTAGENKNEKDSVPPLIAVVGLLSWLPAILVWDPLHLWRFFWLFGGFSSPPTRPSPEKEQCWDTWNLSGHSIMENTASTSDRHRVRVVTVRLKGMMPFADTWFCLGLCSEWRTSPEKLWVSWHLHPLPTFPVWSCAWELTAYHNCTGVFYA